MENLEIKNENGLTKIIIDGVEITGIKSVRFEHDVEHIPLLSLEMYIMKQAGIKDIEYREINSYSTKKA